jgi:hypothetical protein
MQSLNAVELEFNDIEDGKICTIRKGRRSLKLGLLQFVSLKEKRTLTVKVTHVIHCVAHDIPMEYVKQDGFTDKHDMVHQLTQYYPEINENTEITAIIFKSLQ